MARSPKGFSRSAPSRTPTTVRRKAYILILPAPVCLSGADDSDKVSSAETIHVYSSGEAVAQSLKQLVVKKVKVKGNAFDAITAHHHAPIVMESSEIEAD